MTLYVFVISLSVVSFGLQVILSRRSERRILDRIDQAVAGVRIQGHPLARRQVARRQVEPDIRPRQVD